MGFRGQTSYHFARGGLEKPNLIGVTRYSKPICLVRINQIVDRSSLTQIVPTHGLARREIPQNKLSILRACGEQAMPRQQLHRGELIQQYRQ
jgi:hypothetical protein